MRGMRMKRKRISGNEVKFTYMFWRVVCFFAFTEKPIHAKSHPSSLHYANHHDINKPLTSYGFQRS